MEILPLRAFRDNYIWLMRRGRHAAVVDPGDAAPVIDYLRKEGLQLAAILATHHHDDHVGGIDELLRHHPAPVFGPARDPIPDLSVSLQDGDRVVLPELEVEFQVLSVPGHTRGHAAYYAAKLLFCGDTLFGCGCGRLFEGTAAEMHASLARLAALPTDTQVYCAHEYTQANIRFALAVEPDNARLQERAREVDAWRAAGLPSVPSTLELELATNPFLRGHVPAVSAAAARRAGRPLDDEVSVFAEIRRWKDGF